MGHGQYTGKEGKPTLRLEVVCDDNLCIWHAMFGIPGARNDKSIVNQSTLFNGIRNRKGPPYKPKVVVSGTIIEWFNFLADGIYSRYRIFAKPHPTQTSRKQNYILLHTCLHGRQ